MSQPNFVWSIPLKNLRQFTISIPLNILGTKKLEITLQTWPYLSRIFRLPVHTFSTMGKPWITQPATESSGYWYCAGDFCQTNQQPIKDKDFHNINLSFAECLVKPGVELSHPKHDLKVAGGSYFIDFVCHNIVNRIMFALSPRKTLADTGLPLTGYKAIVNSPLGVYGRNRAEWIYRIKSCVFAHTNSRKPNPLPELGSDIDGMDDIELTDAIADLLPTAASEIAKIHTIATGSEIEGQQVTEKLQNIDNQYSQFSIQLFNDWNDGSIDTEMLNDLMEKLLRNTIYKTEALVGRPITQAIYGLYEEDNDPERESGSREDALYEREINSTFDDKTRNDEILKEHYAQLQKFKSNGFEQGEN